MKMRKLVALLLAVLFSALYLAACSNSVLEYVDESGDVAQETESSSSSAKIESSGEQTSEIVPLARRIPRITANMAPWWMNATARFIKR